MLSCGGNRNSGWLSLGVLLVALGACASEATIDLFPQLLEPRETMNGGAGPDAPASAGEASDAGPRGASGEGAQGGAGSGGAAAGAPGASDAGRRGGAGAGAASGGVSGQGAAGVAGEAGAGGQADAPGLADAGVAPGSPLYRYAFNGTGTIAIDDISGADGEIVGGAMLDGSGRLALDGNDDFVDLPNGIVSALSDATFATWVEWNGNNCWHRIFSFGNTAQGEGIVGERVTELFITPVNCGSAPATPIGLTALLELASTPQSQWTRVLSGVPFDVAVMRHTALVFDDAARQLRLYLDGAEVGVNSTTSRLSDLIDENNWLGRSQWEQDYNLPGVYASFEIYDHALSGEEVASLFAAGSD